MAELITGRFEDVSDDLKDYPELEFRAYPNGNLLFYGIDDEGRRFRLPEAKVVEARGYDPTEREKPSKAKWRHDGREESVTVIGSVGYDQGGKQLLYKIREYDEGVPQNELEFESTSEPSEADTLRQEVAALRLEVAEIRASVESLRSENADLRRNNEGLANRVRQLREVLEEHEIPVPELAEGAQDPTEPPADPPGPPTNPPPLRGRRVRGDRRQPGGFLDTISGRRFLAHRVNRNVPEREPETVTLPDGRRIEVVDYEDDSRARVVVGVIGGMAVGAFLLWLGTRIGHDNVKEIKRTVIDSNKDQTNALLQEINSLQDQVSTDHATISQLPDLIKSNHDLLVDKNQLLAQNHDLLLQLQREEAREAAAGLIPQAGGPAKGAFYVEHGSGIIREIKEYAHSRGKDISDNRAYHFYQQLRSHFGHRIVNLDSTSQDTYMFGSDIRLSRPGSAHWYKGAGQMLVRLVNRG